jgi:hypothetical protein
MDKKAIVVVSGLPRSGTSMMMKMLEAGGLEIITDNLRTADEDNRNGYYELEKVKQLDKSDDKSWLRECQGKAVKIISQLLTQLPDAYIYKVVFMRRKMNEILASQNQMLIRRDKLTDKASDEKLSTLFEKHLEQIEKWLEEKPNFDVIYVPYNDVIEDQDKYIDDINQFLDGRLNKDKMKGVVDVLLYRQQA